MWSHLSHVLLCALCVHSAKLICNAFYELCWPTEPISQNWFEEENAGNPQIWLQSPYLAVFVSLKQPIDIHWSWYLGCIWWWVHRMLVNVLSFLVRCTACARTCLGLKVSPCWVRRNTTSLPFGETAELGLFDPRWKNGVVMLKPAEKTDRNIWIFWGWPFCFLMWLFYVLWMRLF